MADVSGGAAAAAAASAASYKKLKEEFVSNLSGGTSAEVFLVAGVAPVAAFVWCVLQRRRSFFLPYTPLACVVDFLLNVGAILLAITLYSSNYVLLSLLLLSLAFFVAVLPRQQQQQQQQAAAAKRKVPGVKKAKNAADEALPLLPKKPFLTTYRGCMMVVTCLAILAVDFRIFPRRFAKVETWGTSLMDMGVGSFVFSAGVVAARPVLKEQAAVAAGGRGGVPVYRRIFASLRHSLPLLVLGIIRLISVKGMDYAEHVTEYGVHWNFFFTLGLLPPFVAAAQAALQLIPSYAALALLVSGLYQLALETTRLKAFILTAPRVDLLSQNREGLFSLAGYLAIFLAGQDAGMYLLPRRGKQRQGNGASSSNKRTVAALAATPKWQLLLRAGVWWLLYELSVRPAGFGLTVSRRLANLPYVLWVLTFNTTQLLCFYLLETELFPAVEAADTAAQEAAAYEQATSRVLEAFNRNGLAVFLLANLLTGLVNMTVPTLDVGPTLSLAILMGYGSVITATALALDAYGITIRL